jgi:hypothetical protein
MSNRDLLNSRGVWLDNKTVEWGEWTDNTNSLLDEVDIKHLKEVHFPFNYKHERAVTVKKAMASNTPILRLHDQWKGLRGFSLRSLQKDALALSRAKEERLNHSLCN